MKNLSDLRVVIVGGGIGGSATAIALHRKGIKADLYEQAEEIKEVGAGIGLRGPTVEYLKKWGLYSDFQKVSSLSDYMAVVAATGEVLVKEEWPILDDKPEDRWNRFIHRADLVDTLLKYVPSQHIHLQHRCKKVVEHEDYVEIEFENGKKVQADLLIAADGIRSTIRMQLFGDIKPVYSGMHAYRAILPMEHSFNTTPDNTFRVIVAPSGAHIYLMPLHHRNEVSFDVTVPSEDTSWRPDVTKEEIVEYLKEFDPKFQKMARLADHFVCRAIYDIDPIDHWTSDRVALLGDAAHAMLHHRGQGANMSIQDAGVLADALEEANTLKEALQLYESRRKPINHQFQKVSRVAPNMKQETAFPEKEVL